MFLMSSDLCLPGRAQHLNTRFIFLKDSPFVTLRSADVICRFDEYILGHLFTFVV